MTVLVGMAELLSLSAGSAEQKQLLQSLKQSSDTLLRMLDEAVDFSRLEAGTLRLEQQEFVLADEVRQVQESLASGATALRLSATIDPAVPVRLVGDADRLRQMIGCLTRSAAKFRPTRAYDLYVRAQGASAGVELQFVLCEERASDRPAFSFDEALANGQRLRLADFAQRGYSGSGLGLPVTAALAELMDGGLWMWDDRSSPLVFRFSATFALASDKSHGNLLDAVEQRLAELPPRADSLHVLLAEDTAANREFFRSVLEQRGHSVVAVSNGQQALEAIQAQPPERPFDLLLLDLEMPVIDGRQAAATIRSLDGQAARRLPLVALTGHDATHLSESSKSLFDAVLTKPCELAHFYAVVESLARGERPQLEPVPLTVSDEQRVDYRGTLRRLGENETLFYDIVRFFLEDAPVCLAELGTALEKRDARLVERSAHSLKGLVSNFGAKEATMLAAELQRFGHDDQLVDAPHIYQRLETEVNLLRRELEGYQAKSPH